MREIARALRIWRGGTGRIGCIALTGPGGAGAGHAIELAAALPESEGPDWVRGRAREKAGVPLEPLSEVCEVLLARAKANAAAGDPSWEAHWDRTIVELAPTLRAILPGFEWGRPTGRAPALRPRLARGRLLDAMVRLILRQATLRPIVIAIDAVDRADPATLEGIEWLLSAQARCIRPPESRARILVIASWASDGSQASDLRHRLAPLREIHLSGATREEWEGWWRRKRECLRPTTLRVLQGLAVLDRPSSIATIASIISIPEAEVGAEVEILAVEGWLRVRADGACEIDDRIACEVVWDGLRPEDRRSLAGACSWHFLSNDGDDLSSFAALAHLAEGGSWAVYQGYARRACAKAEELGVPELALEAASRVIETCRESGQPVLIEDVEMHARLLEASGRGDDAVRAYEEWLRTSDAAPAARGRAFRRVAELYGRAGERRRQLACLDRGLDALAGQTESVERLAIFAELARLGLADANLGESLRWCEVGMDLAEIGALDQDEEFREILRITHEVHFRRGDYIEAENFEKRRLRAARRGNDATATIESIEGLSGLALAKGDLAAANSWAARALDVAAETGSRYLMARALVRLARIRARCGDEAEALDCLDRAQAMLCELREDEDRADVCDTIAVLSLVQGDYDRAAAALYEAVRIRPQPAGDPADGPFPTSATRSAEERWAEIRYHESELRRQVLRGEGLKEAETRLALGDLHLEAGELDEACGMYLAGSRVRELGDSPPLRGRFLVRLARAARLRGNIAQAMAYLTQALELVAEDDARGTVGAGYIEAGLLFLRDGELSKSLRYLARALEVCRDERDSVAGFEAILAVAQFLSEIGRFRSGAVAARAALEVAERAGLGTAAMRAHLIAARTLRLGGRPEEAGAHRQAAERLAASLSPRREMVELRIESAWAALGEKEFERCLDVASAALAEARAVGARDLEAEALLALGRLHAEPGSGRLDFVRARDCLRRAAELGEGRDLFLVEVGSGMADLFRTRETEGGGDQWAEEAASRLARIIDGAPKAAEASLLSRTGFSRGVERLRTASGGGASAGEADRLGRNVEIDPPDGMTPSLEEVHNTL
ncbi:MAG: AAA family ATPase [Planctomycetes bacterium]|nr:AAA family ATPase [Planctomycetota bacterium]